MFTKEEHTTALAQYMPNGPLFEAKSIQDSNFRKLLRGIAGELFTAQGYLITLENQYFPDGTDLFLSEWESALGIPDDCFPVAETTLERRQNILIKLAGMGVQTRADFVSLAELFGKTVSVTSLSEEAFPEYPIPFNPVGLPGARYIIVVSGTDLISGVPPYDVPFDLIVGESLLQCVFDKQSPSNCEVIYRNTN